MEFKNGWAKVLDKKEEIFSFAEKYKAFLDAGKTEREAAQETVRLAKAAGFVDLDTLKELKKGDKVYKLNRSKSVFLSVVGDDICDGFNLVAAHIDSPRLDLKQNPMYEDLELAMFKTHYYGGIKKYQWTTTLLSMHGTFIKRDGTKLDVSLGEKDDEPVFCITDLLPHLAQDQMNKNMRDAITGESLNVMIGSIPCDSENEKVKTAVLDILKVKYGIEEEDFISAEIEFVPAAKARDMGFDKSLIASYGQDDRVCAFTALSGILELDNPKRTAMCLLSDKEEVGSMGSTGMESNFFADTVANMIYMQHGEYNDLMLRNAFAKSQCLSADVGAAMDPSYKEVSEAQNASKINAGITITKYHGARGKSGSSDADAEFVGKIRKLFNDNDVIWQSGELGKVDQGGGGTVAQYIANLNIDTLDCGVPLLSMHAPVEISGKLDVYMAYKGYSAFYLLEK